VGVGYIGILAWYLVTVIKTNNIKGSY